MVVRGEREKEKRRKGGKESRHRFGKAGNGELQGGRVDRGYWFRGGFPCFFVLVRRASCGRAGSARREKKWLEKAIGRKWRFTEIRQAEIRPAEIFQIGTESSSHDLGEEMGWTVGRA